MSIYVTAYTRDYVQPDYKPKLYKRSKIMNDVCQCEDIVESDKFCVPHLFSPTNYCKKLETNLPKEVVKEKTTENVEIKNEQNESDEKVRTTYQEHFCIFDKTESCDDHTLLKKKPKLAIWELDERTLKHMYRKTAKEKAESEQNKKVQPWKSEYDDTYNRTAQSIFRSIKYRKFRRQKAMRLKSSKK